MASAATLFHCVDNRSHTLKFDTLSGVLSVKKKGELLELDLPLDTPETIQDRSEYEELLKFLIDPEAIADVQLGVDNEMLLVRLKDNLTRADLENIKVPGSSWAHAYDGDKIMAIGVTLKAGTHDVDAENVPYDFLSRFFGISCGVDEDPVTGAMHTILSSYWMKEVGKRTLYAHQCSSRGGDIHMEVTENDRVLLSGSATPFLTGSIQI